MRNIRLTIEYDGSQFVGWQRQANGLSVQAALEDALGAHLRERVRITGAGRTDAGVHARGQVANFRTGSALPIRAIHRGLLPHLPDGVTVTAAAEVPGDFDARRSALLRWYRFFLLFRQVGPAVAARYVTHVRAPLRIGLMREAAEALAGTHDFRGLRALSCTAKRTRLDLHQPVIHDLGDGYAAVDFRCRSFLQNMVRILAGLLCARAAGRISTAEINECLANGTRPQAAKTLPPNGLFLWHVYYPGEVVPDIRPAPPTETGAP